MHENIQLIEGLHKEFIKTVVLFKQLVVPIQHFSEFQQPEVSVIVVDVADRLG